jgi:glycogen synthase
MINFPTKPRVLMVPPEVTYLPDGMGPNSNGLNAKVGGLADVLAALISALYNQGADVHVALPDYRSIRHILQTFDQGRLYWAVDQAMQFYIPPAQVKKQQIKRIMMQSASQFNHRVTAQHYINLYKKCCSDLWSISKELHKQIKEAYKTSA